MEYGLTATVDLSRIRHNVQEIARRVRVPVLATVKADAYGMGIVEVTDALADVVDGWCVFAMHEATAAGLWERTRKSTLVLGPPQTLDETPWRAAHCRPAVSNVEQAQALRAARPAVCVDTGMRRFACPADRLAQVAAAGECREVFTHGVRMAHVQGLLEAIAPLGDVQKHAAGSALLGEPAAWLDAVRPGLAIYEGAVVVSARVVEVGQSAGPIGYTGFSAGRHAVVLAGYSHGLRKGPCRLAGAASEILEVGMQSCYVRATATTRVGDEVEFVGAEGPAAMAAAWGTSAQEVLYRLGSQSRRLYKR